MFPLDPHVQFQDPHARHSAWPAGLFLTFAAFLAVQLHMVRVATRGFEGPDEVQYYKMGIEYDRELQRQQSQRLLGWTLRPLPSPLPCDFEVEVRDAAGRPVVGQLTAKFGRPATRSQDQQAQVEGMRVHWLPASGPWRLTLTLQRGRDSWRRHLRTTLP